MGCSVERKTPCEGSKGISPGKQGKKNDTEYSLRAKSVDETMTNGDWKSRQLPAEGRNESHRGEEALKNQEKGEKQKQGVTFTAVKNKKKFPVPSGRGHTKLHEASFRRKQTQRGGGQLSSLKLANGFALAMP